MNNPSDYDCPKCGGRLEEGPAATGRTWSFPLLGCKPCNAVYVHPDHPVPGLEVVVDRRK